MWHRPAFRHPRLACIAGATLLAACGPNLVDVPGPEFPAAETLEQLAATAVEPGKNATGGPRVTLWTLEQPLPTEIGVGPALGESPGELLLRELTQRSPKLSINEQLTCAAHQFARFMAEQGAPPTRALLRYMVHRCGATSPSFGWAALSFPTAPTLAQVSEQLATRGFDAGPVGMWAVERGSQWLVVAMIGKPRAQIDPVSMAVAGDQIIISGQIGQREWIKGNVTHAQHDVGACQLLSGAGGTFRLVCPVVAGDEGAYIDIYAAATGRLLGDLEARIWVSPSGSLTDRFEDPAHGGSPTPITGPLDHEFVTAVNEVRAKAGSGPLTIVDTQSEIVAALRPHFRSARTSGDGAQVDQIVLGLLAGWRLEEPILAGNFSELEFESIGGREHLLEAALSQPGLRDALLNPRASRIAIAVDPGQPNEVLGGMFATYCLATPGERVADREWMRALIDLTRKSHKRSSVTALVGGPTALANASQRVADGKVTVDVALDEALEEIAAQNTGRKVAGFAAFAQDVREFEVPPELMEAGGLALAVHVELVQGSDKPWATLMMMSAYMYE